VKPEPIRWLWPGRVPLGKLTLIVGDPGLGKSFLTLDLAARVSAGEPWPDAPGAENTPGAVVLLSAEDDLADTIRPRLDAAGADVERVAALSISSLQRDLPDLEKAMHDAPGVRLVVIDPITAYLAGTDSHKNADVRSLLAPLAELAARHRVAVVAVSHLNKHVGGSALYRAQGSLAFTAAARAVWLVAKDKADVGRVAWEPDPVEANADEVLSIDPGAGHGRTDRDDAADWLREALGDDPPGEGPGRGRSEAGRLRPGRDVALDASRS